MTFKKTSIALVLSISSLLGAGSASAQGIPVIDVANLANSLQQVISWGTQGSQMVTQINQFATQISQLTSMTAKLDGARLLGMILSDPQIYNLLPVEMRNANNILLAARSSSQIAAVNSILAAYSIPTVPGSSRMGTSAAEMVSDMHAVMTTTQARDVQIDALAARTNSSIDLKDAADLQNRNLLEIARTSNALTKTIAQIEANRETNRLRDIAAEQAAITASNAAYKASR